MAKFDAKCIVLLAIAMTMCFAEDKKIIEITPNQVRNVDESVNLSCTVDPEVQQLWLKRDRERQSDPNILSIGGNTMFRDKRLTVIQNGNTYVLNINNITLDDTGIYECQAIVDRDRKETAQVELLIRRAPEIDKLEIVPSPAPEGNSAIMKCSANGYPRPAIYWSRENDALLPNGGHKVASNEYVIRNVSREDRGRYYCWADNTVGTPSKLSLTFEVEFAPSISVPRPKVAQALEYDIDLVCSVVASPAPTVIWFKNDAQIFDDSDYSVSNTASTNELTTSILHVKSVEASQYGDYVCKANNKVGSAEARVNLYESSIYVQA